MRSLFVLLLLASSAVAGEPVYSWRTNADDPDRVYLYRDGQQVGGWCYTAKQYRPLNGDEWGTPLAKAPVQPPARSAAIVVRPKPITISQPQVRGPFRRLGATMGQTLAEMTVNLMFDAIPKAMVQSVIAGETPVDVQFSTKSTPSRLTPPPTPTRSRTP